MSKDKPEVGDVFFDNTWRKKLIVTFTKYNGIWGLWETGQAWGMWDNDAFHDKTYLGKSKVKIEDLFKTENE